MRQGLGGENPEIAGALNNRAGVDRVQGRYGEALPLLQDALRMEEGAYGPEHLNVGARLNSLESQRARVQRELAMTDWESKTIPPVEANSEEANREVAENDTEPAEKEEAAPEGNDDGTAEAEPEASEPTPPAPDEQRDPRDEGWQQQADQDEGGRDHGGAMVYPVPSWSARSSPK